LREVVWGKLDVLVVDMPPGTGDTQLTMAQTVPLAGAVIVSTPQDLALIDARRGVSMFNQVKVPLIGVVENMSYFVCPTCSHKHFIFGTGGAKRLSDELDVPLLGEIPFFPGVLEGGDRGEPIVVSDPQTPAAEALLELAGRLSGLLAGRDSSRVNAALP
jgi:ATP-binding protein involved in chromosome partitioning